MNIPSIPTIDIPSIPKIPKFKVPFQDSAEEVKETTVSIKENIELKSGQILSVGAVDEFERIMIKFNFTISDTTGTKKQVQPTDKAKNNIIFQAFIDKININYGTQTAQYFIDKQKEDKMYFSNLCDGGKYKGVNNLRRIYEAMSNATKLPSFNSNYKLTNNTGQIASIGYKMSLPVYTSNLFFFYIPKTEFPVFLGIPIKEGFIEKLKKTAKTADVKKYVKPVINTIEQIKNVTNFIHNEYDTANTEIKVWIYCITLQKIIDFTPLVTNIVTNHKLQLSTFSMNLSYMSDFFKQNKSDYIHQSSYDKTFTDIDVFHFVSNNDIIFIQMDKNRFERGVKSFGWVIDNDELPSRYYTMIGLVDLVTETKDANNNININITGNDLSKVLYDDVAVFMPLAFAQGKGVEVAVGTQTKSAAGLKRYFLTGNFDYVFANANKTPGQILYFFRNLLSTLTILEEKEANKLFSGYANANSFDKDYLYQTNDSDRRVRWDICALNLTDGEIKALSGEKTGIMKGVHQIIELSVTSDINKRYVFDASTTNPEGSILSLMNKIVQKPFFELVTKTLGDKYYIDARRVPYDFNSIKTYINKTAMIDIGEINTSMGKLESGAPINAIKKIKSSSATKGCDVIKEQQVLSTNFSFETDFYTWYQIIPNGNILGSSQQESAAILPIVPLDEYIERWGGRPFKVSDNYVNAEESLKENARSSSYKNQFYALYAYDIIYMIESTIYLPFSRKGTITLSKINSDIKPGEWIYFEPTNELFYVLNVSHNFSVGGIYNESTTIQVNRGLKADHIFNDIKKGKWSYFDIVNFDLLFEKIMNEKPKSDDRTFYRGGDDTVLKTASNAISKVMAPISAAQRAQQKINEMYADLQKILNIPGDVKNIATKVMKETATNLASALKDLLNPLSSDSNALEEAVDKTIKMANKLINDEITSVGDLLTSLTDIAAILKVMDRGDGIINKNAFDYFLKNRQFYSEETIKLSNIR